MAWSQCPGARLKIRLDELKTEFITRFLAIFGDFPIFGPPSGKTRGGMLNLIFGFGLYAFHTTNLAWSQRSEARLMMRWDEFKTEFIARFLGIFWGFSNIQTPLVAKLGGFSP